jgi:hypothetical protein
LTIGIGGTKRNGYYLPGFLFDCKSRDFGKRLTKQSVLSGNWRLWHVHVEIVEQNIRSTSVVSAGDQANIATGEGSVRRRGNLGSVHIQSQSAVDAISAQVVGSRAQVDTVNLL